MERRMSIPRSKHAALRDGHTEAKDRTGRLMQAA